VRMASFCDVGRWPACSTPFRHSSTMVVLLPYLTAMINASLHAGHLPTSQKDAILTPLLKKSYLDASDLKNHRPVSNLAFMSKVAERIVIVSHLQEQDLLPRLQSAYWHYHSTETALLHVLSDIYAATDHQDVTLAAQSLRPERRF